MPPSRTQDDVSCQSLTHIRPSPYIIRIQRPEAPAQPSQTTTSKTRDPNYISDSYRPNRFKHPSYSVLRLPSRPSDTGTGTMTPTDRTISHARYDDQLDWVLLPRLQAIQSQKFSPLAEDDDAASDLEPCRLKARPCNSSVDPIPRQLSQSLDHWTPGKLDRQPSESRDHGISARSPTSSLTSIASIEDTGTESDPDSDSDESEADSCTGSHESECRTADQMIMDLLEEDSPSESSHSSESVAPSSIHGSPSPIIKAVDYQVIEGASPIIQADDYQVIESGLQKQTYDLDRDGFSILSPSAIELDHVHLAPIPIQPGFRSTTPFSEPLADSDLEDIDPTSASSSASFQGHLVTPHDIPPEFPLPSIDLAASPDSPRIQSGQLQSLGLGWPSIAVPRKESDKIISVNDPVLRLPLIPRRLFKQRMAGRSTSNNSQARFDSLPEWIGHINALSSLACGIKLRNPLPGNQEMQDQAFMSFRSVFIELFSFSAKASMFGVPQTVSRLRQTQHECRDLTKQVSRVLKLITEVHPYYEGDQFAMILLMLADHLYDKNVDRLRRYRKRYFRKADAVATLSLVKEIESVLVRIYPSGSRLNNRHVNPIRERLEDLRELMRG